MISVQNLMERLRPLVGSRGWDYCVVWKLSEDQRSITWVGCCCGGADGYSLNGTSEEFHFPVSQSLHQCKDVMVQHARSGACELLYQMPSSLPLNSGIYTHSLFSNQPRWLNFASSLDSNIQEETIGTKVLIPVTGGCLIELFVTKQVPEDPQILDFVAAQCSISMEADMLPNNMDSSYNTDTVNSRSVFIHIDDPNCSFIPQASASTEAQEAPLDLPYDIPVDPIRPALENKITGGVDDVYSETSILNMENMNIEFVEPLPKSDMVQENNNDENKDSVKRENGRTDSVSDCSDQNEDEEHNRNGKKGQSKNLVAERNRRKKLNDRLYALRALVPRISKLDRASILGDAIEFIKDLQKQAKELQDELEEHSDVDDGRHVGSSCNNIQSHGSGININPTTDPEKAPAGCESSRQNQHDPEHGKFEKPQQMEPQVEVAQVDGNEFFVKVFGEHRPGGFVRLMEALDALGLEVTNVNMTSFRSLVSNVFTVEKKDSELVQADHVKDSLIELTRNPSSAWQGMNKAPENAAAASGDTLPQLHNHHHHLYPGLLHGHHFLNSPPPSPPF